MIDCPDVIRIRVSNPAPAIVSVRVTEPVPEVLAIRHLSGSAGNPLEFSAVAAEILSSNCFVAVNGAGQLIRADGPAGIPALGFVRQAAIIGAACTVITGGPASGFTGRTPGAAQFVGASGQPTETPPLTGIVQQVATAITATRISIEIQPGVDLA